MPPRERRIENEWKALDAVIAGWPDRVARDGAEVWLRDLPGVGLDGAPVTGVRVRFEFPEYYPAVPLEAFLRVPLRHPNIHPETGFICLWEAHHGGTSLVEGVLQVARVVTWTLVNRREEHVMQPDAGEQAPLAYRPLEVPAEHWLARSAGEAPAGRRPRLSAWESPHA